MIQPVVAQAARQLGLPPAVLRGLAARPDLVALVERELKARPGGTSTGGTSTAPPAGPDGPADPTDGLLAGWLRDD
jgi:hypothetical protein